MKALVIGGTGLTGPHVVAGLRRLGHQVAIFHRRHTSAALPTGVAEILGDKADLASHYQAFKRFAPDVVIHMAAYTIQDAEGFLNVFCNLTRRSVVISSGDVYLAYGRLRGSEPGPPEAVPLTEESRLRERLSPEGEGYNKTSVEAILGSEPRLPCTKIRYPAVYGPNDQQARFDNYFRRIADGRSAILMGEVESRFRFSHGYSEDMARAVVLAAVDDRAVGRIYNVAEASTPTNLERLRRIGDALDWNGRIVTVPEEELPEHLRRIPVNSEQHLVMDSRRIRDELGYSEVVGQDDAIQRTYEWWQTSSQTEPSPPVYNTEDAIIARY
jgi:nucleoside-diphosphate-sugar epimerase